MNKQLEILNFRRISKCLACPACLSQLVLENKKFHCMNCGRDYPIISQTPDFRLSLTDDRNELQDWSDHWSTENQKGIAQQFFSFYRKAVFSRTVAYFTGKYFPSAGILVEAGSGTSETSLRIDKHLGDRTLVAVDIVMPVLQHIHPIMDETLCGDIFHLPFLDNSIDGIWNVGVMEHFTSGQIDQIMREFHRVLKVGSPLLTLWPATFSLPQRILRILEKFINFRKSNGEFRFHPPEISQLNSSRQGREVFSRNGFRVIDLDRGLKSLLAFITIVGKKN